MLPRELRPGEIVQIDPTAGRGVAWFGGCLMIVTESKPWGAIGYVKSAGVDGVQYYRAPFTEIEPTGGMAHWKCDTDPPLENDR